MFLAESCQGDQMTVPGGGPERRLDEETGTL